LVLGGNLVAALDDHDFTGFWRILYADSTTSVKPLATASAAQGATLARARDRIDSRRAGSTAQSAPSARARAASSPAGPTQPLSPSTTASRTEPHASVPRTGSPAASASTTTTGHASKREGKTSASAAASISGRRSLGTTGRNDGAGAAPSSAARR